MAYTKKRWLIYGANGYTGELIAREAKKRNHSPVLAGRNKEVIPSLARELGFEFRVFNLEVASFIIESLSNIDMVLNCAGPFSKTSTPMIEACIASKTHYLDITGEIEVFEEIRKKNTVARQRDVMLMPGIGFDVVPTDCLALNLKKFLPDANTLVLAFDSQGRPSKGTAKTMVEGLKLGGKVRENGALKTVPFVYKVKEIPFIHQTKLAATIPWGDVSTAFYTTGIPNIEVYKSFEKSQITKLKLLRFVKGLLRLNVFQNIMKSKIEANFKNPDPAQRANTRSYIWGQVTNASGQSKEAHLIMPNGYDVTVHAALGIVEYFLKYDAIAGVQTPAPVMGEHFVRTLPGVEMRLP